MQPMKVVLPDGRSIDVEEVVGPDSFKHFIEKFHQSEHKAAAARQNRLFLFFTPKHTPNSEIQHRNAYAMYQNGNHMSFYQLEQNASGITVSHCAPTNERAITPEVRPYIEALNPKEILDMGRQKGIYFNQDQDLMRREPGEPEDAFKKRFIIESVRQIELLQKQQLRNAAMIAPK
jgi:hypothetical protein